MGAEYAHGEIEIIGDVEATHWHVAADGIPWHFVTAGDPVNEPLVLVHGFLSQSMSNLRFVWRERVEMNKPEQDSINPSLVVFGATGKTGSYVLRQALEAGLSVRAAVRPPDKIPPELRDHDRLDVMTVDVTDAATVARAIEGTTMVFAALGYKGRPEHPILLPFVRAVVRAMREHGAQRFVYQASGLIPLPGQQNPAFIRLFARPILEWALRVQSIWREHDAVLRFLVEDVTDLDWTATRPGILSDGESRGALAVSARRGGVVQYPDLASFSLEAVQTGAHARSCPYLYYP